MWPTKPLRRYNRKDIKKIADDIVDKFPNPHQSRKARILKRDDPFVVIDMGSDNRLIPGITGYVVKRDDSIVTEDSTEKHVTQHYLYLAEFIVTEVFVKTSTAVLLYPSYVDTNELRENFQWDIRLNDEVVIK